MNKDFWKKLIEAQIFQKLGTSTPVFFSGRNSKNLLERFKLNNYGNFALKTSKSFLGMTIWSKMNVKDERGIYFTVQ